MALPAHGRYDYHSLRDRPVYDWPDGARLAVYVGLNLEHFAFGEGLGAELTHPGPQPDVLNYSWRDWGNRIGAWRLRDLLDSLRLPCSVLVNAAVCEYCPELPHAFAARGDEIVGHGLTNSERQGTLDETEEADLIRRATETLERTFGHRPAGWLSPWISESMATPDLLVDEGYSYLLDWCHDDQPVWMRTRSRPILSVPYPQEVNDIPAIVVRKAGAAEFADMIVDQFDEMIEQCERQPLVMGIALHPYIVGQPFRLRHLRRALKHVAANRPVVWLTTAGAIARHIAELPAGTVPGDLGM